MVRSSARMRGGEPKALVITGLPVSIVYAGSPLSVNTVSRGGAPAVVGSLTITGDVATTGDPRIVPPLGRLCAHAGLPVAGSTAQTVSVVPQRPLATNEA